MIPIVNTLCILYRCQDNDPNDPSQWEVAADEVDGTNPVPRKDSKMSPPVQDSRKRPPLQDSKMGQPVQDSKLSPPLQDSKMRPPVQDSKMRPPVQDSKTSPHVQLKGKGFGKYVHTRCPFKQNPLLILV